MGATGMVVGAAVLTLNASSVAIADNPNLYLAGGALARQQPPAANISSPLQADITDDVNKINATALNFVLDYRAADGYVFTINGAHIESTSVMWRKSMSLMLLGVRPSDYFNSIVITAATRNGATLVVADLILQTSSADSCGSLSSMRSASVDSNATIVQQLLAADGDLAILTWQLTGTITVLLPEPQSTVVLAVTTNVIEPQAFITCATATGGNLPCPVSIRCGIEYHITQRNPAHFQVRLQCVLLFVDLIPYMLTLQVMTC